MPKLIKEAVENWEISVGTIVTGALTAGVIGAISMIIAMQTSIAALTVRVQIAAEQIQSLRNGTDISTASRYRREDAERDNDLLRKQIDRLSERVLELERKEKR